MQATWNDVFHGFIININNGLQKPTHGYQNYNTKILDRYLKMEESLYTRVVLWINTILKHMNTRAILAWCIDANDLENQNTVKYPFPMGMKKVKSLLYQKEGITPKLVLTKPQVEIKRP